ncbi:MAG: helix-turn-helix domain-containing protein [Candidatus Sericytochromatia bacterium]
MSALLDMETLKASEQEHEALSSLDRLVEGGQAQPKLVDADGNEIVLPETVFHALKTLIHMMAQRKVINLVPERHMLTTNQAADMLNVSRPFLIKLLDQGEIPFQKVGAHRRILFEDLVTYAQQRQRQRRTGLKEILSISQEQGESITLPPGDRP